LRVLVQELLKAGYNCDLFYVVVHPVNVDRVEDRIDLSE
jgi:predicted ABC-type ATPase